MLINLNQDGKERERIENWIRDYLKLTSMDGYDIVFTNGADAAIHAILHSLVPGKSVDCFDLNYSYASTMLEQVSCQVTYHDTDWVLATGTRVCRSSSFAGDFLYVTNPDNRLGLTFDVLPTPLRSNAIVIIDESYGDFEDVELPMKLDKRTLHIRTFSKFFGLEDERIAYIFGPSELMQQVRLMIPQYAIATASIATMEKIILSFTPGTLSRKRAEIASWKEAIYVELDKRDVSYVRTHTDFVTIASSNPDDFAAFLPSVQLKTFTVRDVVYTRLKLNKDRV